MSSQKYNSYSSLNLAASTPIIFRSCELEDNLSPIKIHNKPEVVPLLTLESSVNPRGEKTMMQKKS